jgi:hypothetical protein
MENVFMILKTSATIILEKTCLCVRRTLLHEFYFVYVGQKEQLFNKKVIMHITFFCILLNLHLMLRC